MSERQPFRDSSDKNQVGSGLRLINNNTREVTRNVTHLCLAWHDDLRKVEAPLFGNKIVPLGKSRKRCACKHASFILSLDSVSLFEDLNASDIGRTEEWMLATDKVLIALR